MARRPRVPSRRAAWGAPCDLSERPIKRPLCRRTSRLATAVHREKAPREDAFPGLIASIGAGEERLAARILDLRGPHLLHFGDDFGRHRHVVQILSHLAALGIGPAEE